MKKGFVRLREVVGGTAQDLGPGPSPFMGLVGKKPRRRKKCLGKISR